MKKSKVLLIALGIILLGCVQVSHWYGTESRAAAMGTASGMIALLTGVGMGLYGLSMNEKK